MRRVGPATERKLWAQGVTDWDACLACAEQRTSVRLSPALVDDTRDSLDRFDAGDWSWFNRRLKGRDTWRAFGELGAKALYLDIETDGTADAGSITMIGAYDGSDFRCFVKGHDLEDALDLIDAHPMVVTFNGSSFDLPVIRKTFPGLVWNHIHVDLRYVFHQLGMRGGLKVIEKRLGIDRSDETDGMDGYEAVMLWHAYRRGNPAALDRLIRYNREDVVNLHALMQIGYEALRSNAGKA